MDFKFRATDGQDSMYRTQSSSYSYFTEQALRVGLPNKFGLAHDVFRNPTNNMREAIQRELEKEQIRDEIIAAEIARKRVLEAEVRRELMMEREMALRRNDGFPILSNRLEPRLSLLHQSTGRSFEERIALSLEERYGQSSRREIGGLEMVPFQRHAEPKITEITPLPEDSKEKVIVLGKPSINLSGVKRKAVTPPAASASEQLSAGSKKKPKEEWSCAICQVSATSERGLNEHLMGKKHQSKEAGLRAQRTGGNLGLGVTPKKTARPTKLAEITVNRSLEQRVTIVRKSPLLKKNSSKEGQKKNGEPFNADDSEQKDGKMGEHKRNNFKFWCEMCQVGAFSEKVMNNHRKGKKHVGRLQEIQNGGTALGAKKAKDSIEIAEVETEKVKDLEEVAEERETEKEDLEEVAEEAETVVASEKVEAECQQEVTEVADHGSI